MYPGFSIVNVTDLSCAMWLCAYCRNTYSVLCNVSSKLWLVMFLPGLAEILPAYQLYYVATRSPLQVLCLSEFPRCLQSLAEYFAVLVQCLPVHAWCLAVFPCQIMCYIAAKCSSSCLLPVMCLLDACLKHVFLLLMTDL